MSGSNGLTVMENLESRRKCPDVPNKRKYATEAEAREAARRRANETKLPIVHYACTGCGGFHLTKGQGDTGPRTYGDISVPPAKRAELPEPEPEQGVKAKQRAEREVNRELLAEWLTEQTEPVSTPQVCELLGVKVGVARSLMRDLGYETGIGKKARWRKVESDPNVGVPDVPIVDSAEVKVREPRTAAEAVDQFVAEANLPKPTPIRPLVIPPPTHPVHTGKPWQNVELDKVAHMTVGDLVGVYEAAGLEVRLSVR